VVPAAGRDTDRGAQAAEPVPFADEDDELDEPDVVEALDEDDDEESEELEDSLLAAGTLAEEPERESVR
jgi:hypothetical protein